MSTNNKIIQRSALAFANVGRTLLLSVFGLLLNYILLHYHSHNVFNTYVYFISVFGLFYSFTNWGGKFFITKQISKSPKNAKVLVSDLISSKVLLLLVCCLIILFLNLEFKIKLLMIAYLFLKSFSTIYDSLILYRKKSSFVFVSEVILFSAFLFLIFIYHDKFEAVTFLITFVLFELVKFLYYLIELKSEISVQLSAKKGYQILIDSLYFFGVSLAGFIASKSDFYIVGILINQEAMSKYFVISGLSALSMVVYSTSISTFITSFYRLNTFQFKKLGAFLMGFGFLFSIISAIVSYCIINFFYEISIDYIFGFLLFLNSFFFALLQFEMYRFTKLEKQKVILICLVISGIMNCVFSFLLVKQLLLIGAFLANTLGLLLNYLMMRYYFISKINHEI